MERRRVGETGVSISRVGIGGYELGPEPDERPDVEQAVAVVRTGIDGGVNWVDTSENYLAGNNESLIGAALKRLPPDLLVCTKVAPYAALTGGASGFRPEQVHAACRGSLRRLGRGYLDLYLLHYPDQSGVPLADTWGAMGELQDAGLVRAIGMSNYDLGDIERCHAQRAVNAVQTGLSLVDYLGDCEMIRRCGQLGIAVTIYEPVASGVLTDVPFEEVRARWAGTVWEESAFFQRVFSGPNGERCRAASDRVREIGARLGVPAAQVAIAWVLWQPGVTAAIAGSRSVSHTAENVRAADIDISSVLDELESLTR